MNHYAKSGKTLDGLLTKLPAIQEP